MGQLQDFLHTGRSCPHILQPYSHALPSKVSWMMRQLQEGLASGTSLADFRPTGRTADRSWVICTSVLPCRFRAIRDVKMVFETGVATTVRESFVAPQVRFEAQLLVSGVHAVRFLKAMLPISQWMHCVSSCSSPLPRKWVEAVRLRRHGLIVKPSPIRRSVSLAKIELKASAARLSTASVFEVGSRTFAVRTSCSVVAFRSQKEI